MHLFCCWLKLLRFMLNNRVIQMQNILALTARERELRRDRARLLTQEASCIYLFISCFGPLSTGYQTENNTVLVGKRFCKTVQCYSGRLDWKLDPWVFKQTRCQHAAKLFIKVGELKHFRKRKKTSIFLCASDSTILPNNFCREPIHGQVTYVIMIPKKK